MIVGLTGGIGSGKSTVASYFEQLGIPVYDSDYWAKKLMESDSDVITQLKNLLGEEAYKDGVLQRKWIASKVFGNSELLQRLNGIIHPSVGMHFANWNLENSAAPYVIKEAAILFESGAYKSCDIILVVTASEEERIARVMRRDGVSESEVRMRMSHQWPEEEKISRADYVIYNNDLQRTKSEVERIHLLLSKKNELD